MKRHALFVGVNDYADNAFKNLRYSLSDAVALSGVFAARGFDVEVLSNPKADSVLGAVERKAAGLGPGDVFLFFFAGHGFTSPDGSHLLICSNDRLAYLRHNRAGIPVNLLEEITNGRGCNRAFLLDACRTDVFAGVENRGAETRDLAFISLPDAKVHAGTCCVLRSCDRFCPAMEFDDLGHGVFTRAVMDVLEDDSMCATPFGESFVAGIRAHMQEILLAHSGAGVQNPCFQTNGAAFYLFDDMASSSVAQKVSASNISADSITMVASTLVVCPVCGKKNHPENTFRCRECGRDNLCLRHQDGETFLCSKCTTAQRRVRDEAQHKADADRKEAEHRAREEAQHKAEADRKGREEEDRKAREEAEREEALRNGTCRETGICRKLTLPGGAAMEMIYCPPGEFVMGSPLDEEGRFENEREHLVTITKGFWMGRCPVTQKQWISVMGNNPSGFIGDDFPVETVNWLDCQVFIRKVNAALDCGARLPTEAEWEYACRAGKRGRYGGTGNIDDMGWYRDNSRIGELEERRMLFGLRFGGMERRQMHSVVGKKSPNDWGIFDMHGNVWEWCADWCGIYPSDEVDPKGPNCGNTRVLRGGSYLDAAGDCRSARHNGNVPDNRWKNIGFRLCCSTLPRDSVTLAEDRR